MGDALLKDSVLESEGERERELEERERERERDGRWVLMGRLGQHVSGHTG